LNNWLSFFILAPLCHHFITLLRTDWNLALKTFDLYKFSFGVFHSQLLAMLWTIAKVCSCLPLVLKWGNHLLAQNLFISSCFILGLCIFGVFHDHHFCDLSGIHLRNRTLKRAKWYHKWTNWNEVCLYCLRCLHTWVLGTLVLSPLTPY
jgi:hypothetical protein